jgi:UDP-N-acetylglucosamine--N-acetylmuramyl-(pentapeptide) pyrophosphoryl-undecaprenol N-acetylglucosamine transferase
MTTAMTRDPRPVMILAGGTGGHIFPGLAVAAVLRARDVPVCWLGADGAMETRLVPGHGVALDTIAVRGVRGKGLTTLLAAPGELLAALLQARRVFVRRRPRAVVSFGGFAAGPGGLMAWWRRVPLVVHEQNRAAGLTNRVLARLASAVLTGFPGTFRRERVVGNPVRAEIVALPPRAPATDAQQPLRVLVLGGSQGARALNEAMPRVLAALGTERLSIRHQCGRHQDDATRAAYAQAGVALVPEPFIADMAAAYAWADVVVCRAGALTLAELCAAGVASVLVPFPQAVDDHQTRNAEFLVERGAAILQPQAADLADRLATCLLSLHDERARLAAMAQAARALARADAAEQVADAVLAVAHRGVQA